ncbi:MAG: IclR family transcriptional regulator [Planctomycetia bacterium]|nr:IclR family transcriptional regulator [Planctomycetia bacterium]
MTSKKTVMPAADLTLRLIKLFASEQCPLRLKEIVEGLETNQATAIRLISVLEEQGWMQRIGAKGPYQLTYLPLYYIGQALSGSRLAKLAAPLIKNLARETNTLAVLSVPDERQVTCVVCENSTHPIRVSSEIGCSYQYHCDAAGKAVIPWLGTEFIDRVLSEKLEKYGPNTITAPDKLRSEFSKIRKLGYALDQEEHYSGVVCIGVPVFDYRNTCIASITLGSLTFYDTTKTLVSNKKEAIMAAGESVSRIMGYAGPYPTDDPNKTA